MPAVAKLVNRHLILDAEVAAQLFPNASHVNMVYYANNNTLLLANTNDEAFKKLHKTSMQMIKDKNLRGDKSISLEELLIDQDIDPSDRELPGKIDAAMGILSLTCS